jgi:hypothetical protein
MAATTDKGSDGNKLPGMRFDYFNKRSDYGSVLHNLPFFAGVVQKIVWSDWLFPISAQDGTGNAHVDKRKTRTWARNQ